MIDTNFRTPQSTARFSVDKAGRSVVTGLDVELTVQPGCVLVCLTGEIDIATVPRVRDALDAALRAAADGSAICCDLGGVSFIDSMGLGALVRTHAKAAETGHRFCVIRADGFARRTVELAQLDSLIPFYPSLDAAMWSE